MLIEQRIDGVDFERVLADQSRLHRQNLLFDADPRSSVCFRDAVKVVIGQHLHQHVGAGGSLERHGADIANLEALPLGRGKLMVTAQERHGGCAQE